MILELQMNVNLIQVDALSVPVLVMEIHAQQIYAMEESASIILYLIAVQVMLSVLMTVHAQLTVVCLIAAHIQE